jgi:cell division protein FtsW (lipid II flippase)
MQLSNAPEQSQRWPLGLIAVAALIPLIGVMQVSSAARETMPDLWYKQLLWVCAGFVLGALVARVRGTTLELMAYPLYVVTCALLVLVLVIGTPIKGAQRWLDLGPMNMQPSELAKIAIILVCAKYFGSYEQPGGYTLLQLLRPLNISRPLFALAAVVYRHCHLMAKHAAAVDNRLADIPDLPSTWLTTVGVTMGVLWLGLAVLATARGGLDHRRLIAPIDIVMLPFVLVLIEPDLGTSSIVLAIAATIILFCGMRLRDLLIGVGCAVSIAVLAWFFVLHDYQKKRVETFLNPEADTHGAGYHAAQSIIAVGSGEITGKGFGQGTQTQLSFLPENHTDFIFSVIGEEWGFVGGAVLIVLLFALIALMLRGARRATDRFSALIAVGAAAMIFWHAFINIGMVIGVLPVVGVTLPLMSYGGSSMITKVVAIGFAVNAQLGRKS